MGKNKKEKPELTLENLNRAIRTYQQLVFLTYLYREDMPTLVA